MNLNTNEDMWAYDEKLRKFRKMKELEEQERIANDRN